MDKEQLIQIFIRQLKTRLITKVLIRQNEKYARNVITGKHAPDVPIYTKPEGEVL